MRLWKYLPFLVLTLLFNGFSAPGSLAQSVSGAGTAMTNADVVALVGAGLPDEVVTAKIQAAPATAFDTSVNGLTALKTANVSPAVIRVMISPHPAATYPNPYAAANSSAGGNSDDPAAPHSPGIYTLNRGADGQMHMVRLESTKQRGAKNSGMFLHALTQGITTSKSQSVLDGASAAIELSQTRPVFYAYIPDYGGSFTGGMSVKDLVLTKLEVKGDTRLWTYAARGLIGGSSEVGSDEKDRQGFTSEQVKPGIYKLTPAADLAAGQYAFKYSFSFFDFGILPGAASLPIAPPTPAAPPIGQTAAASKALPSAPATAVAASASPAASARYPFTIYGIGLHMTRAQVKAAAQKMGITHIYNDTAGGFSFSTRHFGWNVVFDKDRLVQRYEVEASDTSAPATENSGPVYDLAVSFFGPRSGWGEHVSYFDGNEAGMMISVQ